MRRSTAGNLYWSGEVFFTATAIARSLIDWKNDSFTTLVALSALLNADKVLALITASAVQDDLPGDIRRSLGDFVHHNGFGNKGLA